MYVDFYIEQNNITDPHDIKLIREAGNMPWEEIDEDLAHTDDGKSVLHRIMMLKYHRDEYRNNME